MDINYYAYVEQELDRLRSRVSAMEEAMVQLPAVDYEPDPSRLQGVKVAPAPAPQEGPPVG